MKCHRPWNENFRCYFRTESCIGCCAVWQLCCSPEPHSRTPVWPRAFLAFFSKQRCFDLCQRSSDPAKEAYKCITMIAGEHYNAFDISLFRKPWEDWKCSLLSGLKKAGWVVSRLAGGCAMCGLTWKGEQWAVWGPAGFQSSYLLTLSVAVCAACFCVS